MLVLTLALSAGCGDDGAGTDAATDTVADAVTDGSGETVDVEDELPAPTHEADIQPIWTARCTPCHVGSASGGLDLSAGSAHGNIVNVPSTGLPTMDLVEPGSTADSYLWHKLSGTQGSVGGTGDAMPFGGSLTAHELDLVERWIEAGATE
jgi:hypothetical protein